VDNLNLIQVGLTLCDEDGNYPKEASTWQFNFHFDLNKDIYSIESIELLSKSGINFDKLLLKGMQMERFGECLFSSGLILNEDITWISFHGAYDFAYLLKILTNLPLPDNETSFLEQVQTYFPSYYDVRFLVKKDNFRGSLTKLAQGLEINRIGSQHQAGSDSIVTSEIFFRLRKFSDFDEVFFKGRNFLFGLGFGSEDNEMVNFNQNYYANSTVNTVHSHVFNTNPTSFQKAMMNNNNSYMMDNNANSMFINQMNGPFYNANMNMNPLSNMNNNRVNNNTNMNAYNNFAYSGYMPNTMQQGGMEFSQKFTK